MDKVIIDDVDVSGCNNIDEWKHCNICQVLIKTIPNRNQCLIEEELRCDFYPDCYYKQLKRLQAEYDDLHLNYAGCKTANAGLQELNNELKKENMHYKHLIAKIRTIAKTGIEGFCPECSLRYCEENNCYETAIIDIYDLLKKEDEDKNE